MWSTIIHGYHQYVIPKTFLFPCDFFCHYCLFFPLELKRQYGSVRKAYDCNKTWVQFLTLSSGKHIIFNKPLTILQFCSCKSEGFQICGLKALLISYRLTWTKKQYERASFICFQTSERILHIHRCWWEFYGNLFSLKPLKTESAKKKSMAEPDAHTQMQSLRSSSKSPTWCLFVALFSFF